MTHFILFLAFLNKSTEFFIDSSLERVVTIEKLFVVLHKDDLVSPFDIVKHSTSIFNLDVIVFLLMSLSTLINAVSR